MKAHLDYFSAGGVRWWKLRSTEGCNFTWTWTCDAKWTIARVKGM